MGTKASKLTGAVDAGSQRYSEGGTKAFDEALANRVRSLLAQTDGLVEKKMIGGLAFLAIKASSFPPGRDKLRTADADAHIDSNDLWTATQAHRVA